MIIQNNNLILQVKDNISQVIEGVEKITEKRIGAIYKGAQLVWLTIYDMIKSCFGSGIWLGNRPWLKDDMWKNNN